MVDGQELVVNGQEQVFNNQGGQGLEFNNQDGQGQDNSQHGQGQDNSQHGLVQDNNPLNKEDGQEQDSHSQDGLVLCGGYSNSGRSCYSLKTTTAQWTKTHSLSEKRDEHSSWRREDGTILLMGGVYSRTTTELVSESSGVSTPGFTLKYETR